MSYLDEKFHEDRNRYLEQLARTDLFTPGEKGQMRKMSPAEIKAAHDDLRAKIATIDRNIAERHADRVRDLLRTAGLPRLHASRAIDLQAMEKHRWGKCLAAAREKVAEGGWALLLGKVGSGKTQLATQILREWMETESSGVYATLSGLLAEIRATYDAGGGSEYRVVQRFATCGLLAIDEIDRAKLTPWGAEKLCEIIDERYRNLRPMIIAGNCTPDALVGLLGDAMADRIIERGKVLAFTWASFRGKAGAA